MVSFTSETKLPKWNCKRNTISQYQKNSETYSLSWLLSLMGIFVLSLKKKQGNKHDFHKTGKFLSSTLYLCQIYYLLIIVQLESPHLYTSITKTLSISDISNKITFMRYMSFLFFYSNYFIRFMSIYVNKKKNKHFFMIIYIKYSLHFFFITLWSFHYLTLKFIPSDQLRT